MRLSSLPAFTGRAPRLAPWRIEHKKPVSGRYLVAEESKPETIEFEMLFNQGGYKLLNYARTQKHPNGGIQRFRHEEVDASQPLASMKGGFKSDKTKIVDELGRPVMPTLLIDWVELEGPLTTETLRANKKRLLLEKDDPGEVHASLKRFAQRAWRRPITDAELEPDIQFIAAEKEAGESFQSAYKSALSGMLVAVSFFNLEEGSPGENRQKVNDFELASRLSYFLWSSMPDEELFAAARNGELHKPGPLAQAIDRMIADPKVDRFLNPFRISGYSCVGWACPNPTRISTRNTVRG